MGINERNDLDFFEEMYHLTYKLVYYIINRIVNNPHITEDLVQDAFLSAYKNLESLSPKNEESFKAWIGVIAANKAKDYLKKKKPYLFSEVGSSDYEFEPEDYREELWPDQLAHNEELKLLVNKVMEELPEDQRLVILMYYYQQFSIKEISELIDLKESTVKSKLNYARNKIRGSFNTHQISDYRYRSISPLFLFVSGLQVIPNVTINPQSYLTLMGTIKQSLDDKKRSSRRKLGVSLLSAGLLISFFNFFSLKDENQNNINHDSNQSYNEKVDLFDFISVSFKGDDGNGKLNIIIKESDNTNINNELQKVRISYGNDKLFNGSLVLVSIENADELLLEISSAEKYYVVDGLH